MSENDNRTPSYKPQFTLTVLSKELLSDKISKEIDTVIGERVNYKECGDTFDRITHTHRFIFTFSPVSLEASKRRIQDLAVRNKKELTIFFDENKTFGIRKLLEQIQIAFDLIWGIMLPTEAIIIIQTEDIQQRKNMLKSLTGIFFNGNTSKTTLKSLKNSKEWCKATFKVAQPIKFRDNFVEFKNQNKGLVIFGDIKRKSVKSYVPYTGFLGMALNIIYFRDLLLEYVDQLIMACYNLVKGQ